MERSDRQSKFYTRGFTTFLIVGTFLMLLLSGFILYIAPKGRVANWTGWGMLGIGKEQWGSLHINMAVLFLLVAALHVFYNWKVLLNYIRNKKSQQLRRGKELIASIGVVLLVGIGTLGEWVPFHSVIVLHEDIKAYWDTHSEAAPVAHAEDLTLVAFAKHVGITGAEAIKKLNLAGIEVASAEIKVHDIAEANNMKPVDIYSHLKAQGDVVASPVLPTGGGYGRMTVAELALVSKQDVSEMVAKLQARGYQADASSNLRQVALGLRMTPVALVSELTGQRVDH